MLTQVVTKALQVPPQGRCFNDAYVGAMDWRWRAPGGDWVTGGQVASSVLERGPTRPEADGTMVRPENLGFGLKAYLNKEGGKHWIGSVNTDLESTKFDVNDLGYNQRGNQFAAGGNIEHRDLVPAGPFLEHHEQLFEGQTFDARGLLISQGNSLNSYGRFRNFWIYYVDLHFRPTKFDDREVGDGTALQRQGRVGNETYLGTDSTKRVSLGVDQITEVIYDGLNLQGNADLNLRILPQFELDLLPTWQWTYGEPRFAEDGAGPNQLLFGKLDAKALGITLRTTYTFAPRLTLQAYAQLFLASGHYTELTQFITTTGPRPAIRISDLTRYSGTVAYNPDFEQGVLNVNVVLRWEYVLGSTLFLVYTRSQTPTTTLDPSQPGALNLGAVGRAPAADILLAKLTYWWGG